MKNLPLLAITTGDPAGIGPEISLRAAQETSVRGEARLLLIGDYAVLSAINAKLALGVSLRVHEDPLALPKDVGASTDVIDVLDAGLLPEPLPLGQPTALTGQASYQYILLSILLARKGLIQGIVTAPISKIALHAADVPFPGHTEIYGEMLKSEGYAMLMYSPTIACGLVTCHQSLASVPAALSADRISLVARLMDDILTRLRGRRPRLAVLGLNPHAGEDGLFGSEEVDVVVPAIAALRDEGLDVTGPLPPDTAFTRAALARFDGHVCLYHDQGLIPFKMACFDEGVNITMGLPVVRTSVDHGTAFDLAGKGTARIESIIEAIRAATRLAS